MLIVRRLHARLGATPVLRGVQFELRPGEIVSLLGRNGSGRSTTLKAIMGLVPADGELAWCGHRLLGRAPFQIARLGVGYVPESRDVFPTLSVHQNLLLGCKRGRAPVRWSFDDSYRLFPQLRERRDAPAGVLSGGEQQMLSLCRSLMGDPALIMVDEPTEGLAPAMVALVAHCLLELKARGVAVLLVEQKLAIALQVAERCLLMGHGRVVFDGTPAALREQTALRREWLEV